MPHAWQQRPCWWPTWPDCSSGRCSGGRGSLCAQVRTQTLVKSAIIQVDATPFKQFYQQHYGVEVGRALLSCLHVTPMPCRLMSACMRLLHLCSSYSWAA